LLDALFAVFVCALAFLLAATPARNSDLWLHLAAGRLLAEGRFPGWTDPFASTTAGVLWVNHAWGWDALLYGLYQFGGGGAGLVVAKCVLVTVLAGLFFAFRRPRTRGGVLPLAAAAAVLALGPWLLLQSALVSLLGVVLTLYLLERPSLVEDARAERAAGSGDPRRTRWLLVPLFALWANLDAWFLLGPGLVGLYALGEVLHSSLGGARSVRGGEVRGLVLLTAAGLAACLLTPYHYHTFAWPPSLGLSHAERVLGSDPVGQWLVVSPFGAGSTTAPAFVSPGGWAYCLLLAAGAASFGLRGRALYKACPSRPVATGKGPGRLLAWLALAALSVYQARAIPFFAVVGGPVLALNVQEWARTAPPAPRLLRRLLPVARGLGMLAGLALLVLAWPGWLQPAPYQPRAWAVEPDGSLARLAIHLARQHADPKLPPAHSVLTFSPDAAHYLAWFCPAERGFLDSRWPLFDRVAEDFVRMRRCLLRPQADRPDPALGPLLEAHQVDRIVLYDPDWDRTAQGYRCLLLDEQEWDLLAREGTAALFGRRPGAGSPSPWKAIDPRREAYHPEPNRRAPPTATPAPRPPGLFDPFSRARDDRSPDRGEAALHLLTFDLKGERMREELGRRWLLAQATGLVGSVPGSAAGPTAGALAVRLHLTPVLPESQEAGVAGSGDPRRTEGQESGVRGQPAAEQFAAGFLALHDRGPPEELLLAVRAARRALSTNPEDAGAFFLLGGAYLRLARQTREQGWQADLPEIATLRRTQALCALEQAVLLRPDLDEAHALLAQLYSEEGELDRTLDHLRARLRVAEHEASKGGPAAPAAQRQAALQADVKALEGPVRRAQDIYEANTQGKTDPSTVLARAQLAARHGLSRKALELLLGSHPAIFGKPGVVMQLELMLGAGRAFEVRAWLEPEHEAVIGFTPYRSFQAWAAAACGDYAGADAELDRLSEPRRQVLIGPGQLVPVRSVVALRVGGAVLARPAPGTGPAGLAGMAFRQFEEMRPLPGPVELLRQEADVRVLRGLLALESGAVEDARAHFQAALDTWGSESRAATGAGVDFPARPIAQQALRLLDEAGP
jgi:tetratricopeptide (TPR) repeat protein